MTVLTATRRTALVAGLGIVMTAIAPRPAGAEDLAAAKQAGWLGERIDGYLGVVRADTPADIRALADEINAKRRQGYARIAEREGVSVDAVAQLAGQKVIDRADRGEWILGADGNWRQK